MPDPILRHCYFSGIAGGGMSALAQVQRLSNLNVSGSDRSFDRGLEMEKRAVFERMGIRLFSQDGTGLRADHTALIVSTAIEGDNPEIQRAGELSIPVLHRSELLARLCAAKKTVAVAGTSGKSTVTGMVYHVLEAGGLSPSLITGANLLSLHDNGLGNAASGSGEWMVVEADESDGTLIRYNPEIAVLLNIERDHQEIEALVPLFKTFIRQSRRAVINQRDFRCLALKRKDDVYFDGESAFGIRVEDLVLEEWRSQFKLGGVPFEIGVPGRHNVSNAMAAIATGRILGVSLAACAEGIRRFRGIDRRYVKMGEHNGITVVDDFAHNPSKIAAALETAKGRRLGKNRRVLAIFHPHGFAPMKLMGRDIMDAVDSVLDPGDKFYMPEIFYAGGTADKTISSADLIARLNAKKPIGTFLPTKAEVMRAVATEARPGDFVISMGARDPALDSFAKDLLSEIAAQHVEHS